MEFHAISIWHISVGDDTQKFVGFLLADQAINQTIMGQTD